jgi:hypothetical protein
MDIIKGSPEEPLFKANVLEIWNIRPSIQDFGNQEVVFLLKKDCIKFFFS